MRAPRAGGGFDALEAGGAQGRGHESAKALVVVYDEHLAANLATAGAVIQSIAVGTGATCASGTAGTLQAMADGTGGTCRAIADPGALPDIIPDLVSSSLDSLSISVDGGAATPITTVPALPQPGAISVNYTTTVANLGPGDRVLCVTAQGAPTPGAPRSAR